MSDYGWVMLSPMVKRLASKLPLRWQMELKRLHYGRMLRKGTFLPDEPEYDLLPHVLAPGDFVLDIGANIGHYTASFSRLVAAQGRVFAFEPVPRTFALLAATASQLPYSNVTLFNVAISDRFASGQMVIPLLETGLDNPYMAHLSGTPSDEGLSVTCMPVDALRFPGPISLVKIDAEGHDRVVLLGMRETLSRDRPLVIVEDRTEDVANLMKDLGYRCYHLPKSPNNVFVHSTSGFNSVVGGMVRG